jgi:hypothetical protein
MTQILFIGLAAGAAAAILFATLATGTPFAMGLFYLTPLPLLLAGLAANHLATVVGAALAAALIGAMFNAWLVLGFLVAIALPAYVLVYLAMLARPAGNGGGEQLEWYPPGRLVIAAAVLAAFSTALTIPLFGFDLESYRAELRATFERVLRAMTATPEGTPIAIPGGRDPDAVLDVLTIVMPPTAAALTMVTNSANLWLAGLVARVLGRLRRPWPDISALRFPNSAPIALVAAIAVSFAPGLIGLVATILTATLFVAYAVLGFAVLHAVTRRLPARIIMLAAVWLFVLSQAWPALIVAIIGLADAIVDFRARFSGGPPQVPTQRPPSNS